MTPAKERDAAAVEILSKAAAVVFDLQTHGESTVAQLAGRVGEPVSSTYRLLTQLTSLGWVERGSRRGLFRLGVLLLRVGDAVEDRIDIRQVALPALRGLRSETGGTAFLCVRRGDSAACIERVDGGAVRSLAMRLGDAFALHRGAAPFAILAFLPAAERTEYLSRLARVEGSERADGVAAGLRHVRERGFTVSDGDVTPGIAAVGAPVYNHRGELAGAISVGALRESIGDLAATGALVMGAAEAISVALGREAGS